VGNGALKTQSPFYVSAFQPLKNKAFFNAARCCSGQFHGRMIQTVAPIPYVSRESLPIVVCNRLDRQACLWQDEFPNNLQIFFEFGCGKDFIHLPRPLLQSRQNWNRVFYSGLISSFALRRLQRVFQHLENPKKQEKVFRFA
jgi:hypothetical protein